MSIHVNYKAMEADTDQTRKDAVDAAFTAAQAVLIAAGLVTSNTDPAERLVEAIATYIVDSETEAKWASRRAATKPTAPPKPMNPTELSIGDTIETSPVGSGVITGFTERGYPQVNHIAVVRLMRTDGLTFDPTGTLPKP